MEGGLHGGCRPWRGNGEGRRTLEGRMDRGGNHERGIVGRTGGGEVDRMDGVAMGRRGRCGEGGREGQRVVARGGEMRRGLERGRHMERRWNRDGGRDGDRGGGRKEMFPSGGGTGFQPPRVDPSIPHPSNCEERH